MRFESDERYFTTKASRDKLITHRTRRVSGILRSSTMKRFGVNKGHSARKFRNSVGRAKAANFRPPMMRGGYRL